MYVSRPCLRVYRNGKESRSSITYRCVYTVGCGPCPALNSTVRNPLLVHNKGSLATTTVVVAYSVIVIVTKKERKKLYSYGTALDGPPDSTQHVAGCPTLSFGCPTICVVGSSMAMFVRTYSVNTRPNLLVGCGDPCQKVEPPPPPPIPSCGRHLRTKHTPD